MISLSGGESDTDLLGPDLGVNSHEDINTTKPFSVLDELIASPPIHNSTAHSTISATNLIPTTNYSNTQRNTRQINTPVTTKTNKSPTTHILRTLRNQPTTTTLFTSTTPPLHTSYNTSPLPINPNAPSTTTEKSKTTPSDTQSEYLPFAFHFIPNRPNYISKLKLPMNLSQLYTDIQRNAEFSIIRIVEEHLTKQNKHRNSKKIKIKMFITSNQDFNPRNTHPLHLSILFLRLIPPAPQKLYSKDPKSICPPQPHNIPNQPPKISLTNQAPTIHLNTPTHLHHQTTIVLPSANNQPTIPHIISTNS